MSRRKEEELSPTYDPDCEATLYNIKFYHGGVIRTSPVRYYEGGKEDYFDYVDATSFGPVMMIKFVEELGYEKEKISFWHQYGHSLHMGARFLNTEEQVYMILKNPLQKEVVIYVDHDAEHSVQSFQNIQSKAEESPIRVDSFKEMLLNVKSTSEAKQSSGRKTRKKNSIISGGVDKLKKLDTQQFEIYMEKVWELISEEKRNMVAYFDSLWFSSYSKGFLKEKLIDWIKRTMIFSKKFVIVPIVQWGHWNLLILCDFGVSPFMLLFDSLKMAHSNQLEPQIRKFVLDIFKAEERSENEEFIGKIPFIIPNVPQQEGADDCGYYVLYYIKLFLESVPVDFCLSMVSPDVFTTDLFTRAEVECFVEGLDLMLGLRR